MVFCAVHVLENAGDKKLCVREVGLDHLNHRRNVHRHERGSAPP